MKKFSLLALAAVTAASAFGAGRQVAIEGKVSSRLQVEEQKTVLESRINAKAKAPAIATIDEVAGEYTWNYYGMLQNANGYLSGIVSLEVVDAATGEVNINGLFSAGTGIAGHVKGYVDLEAGKLTVPNKQNLGPDSYGDTNYFYLKEIDDEGYTVDGASEAESVEATIDGKSFIFPELCVFAVGDFDNEALGWWMLTCENEFVEYAEPDDTLDLSQWTKYSTATMEDGWIIPVLQYQDDTFAEPADFPLSVEVYQNNEDENLFALANPYTEASGFPLGGGQDGFIVLDIADPEFVLVYPGVFSGFMNGSNRIYCFNVEGFWVAAGYDKETIQSVLTDLEWSTAVTDDKDITITVPNCRFNYPGAEDKQYTWNGRAEAMQAKIVIERPAGTGVKGIENADSQIAPIYYNLQGVEVANPEAGQLVICRQGDKATKKIIK